MLLKNARSEAVRQEFLSMPQGEYTSKHAVEVLVSLHSSSLYGLHRFETTADAQRCTDGELTAAQAYEKLL